ncbi:MAG TPA: hypothetical protein VFG53_18910 [Anaeromyxobacter sp.]|nr:hypothetical protein [Anaeromyxobacter sp.]
MTSRRHGVVLQTATQRPLSPPGREEGLPHYLRVYGVLRRRIEDHEYPVGSFLSPEPELGNLLAVSPVM